MVLGSGGHLATRGLSASVGFPVLSQPVLLPFAYNVRAARELQGWTQEEEFEALASGVGIIKAAFQAAGIGATQLVPHDL